jgi:hypothetical protein
MAVHNLCLFHELPIVLSRVLQCLTSQLQLVFTLQPAVAHKTVLHDMEHHRAAIEDLKQQKTKYELLLAELQAQKNGVPAAHGQQQQATKLQQLANTYRHKVKLVTAARTLFYIKCAM